jgi:hypothetical protein
MVATIHESVRTGIVYEIKRQLRAHSPRTGKAAEYAWNITYKGLLTLDFSDRL